MKSSIHIFVGLFGLVCCVSGIYDDRPFLGLIAWNAFFSGANITAFIFDNCHTKSTPQTEGAIP